MLKTQIAIYGAGGFGRQVAWIAEVCCSAEMVYEVVCFIDDNCKQEGHLVNDVPVMRLDTARKRFPEAKVVGGVGDPRIRQILIEKAEHVGFTFATLVHPRVERSRWLDIGLGTVISAGTGFATNVVLGQHVQINLDCTIGEDVILDDYTTLTPGVHVSGAVHTGKRVYLGTGAVIKHGTREHPIVIGDDAIVGAGAVVTKSVPPGATVVGVPARPIVR